MPASGASRSTLLLARLAAIAAGLGTGQVAALASELDELPERAIETAIEDSEIASDPTERAQLLRLLALDQRAGIRLDVARSLAHAPMGGAMAEDVVAQLAVDGDGRVRRLAADDLIAQLRVSPALERTELLARWAVDPLRERRLALARALASDPAASATMLAARSALELLAVDTSHEVRAVAIAALATIAAPPVAG